MTYQAADLTAQAISTELELAHLQPDKLALELEVLKLRAATIETEVADGADSSKLSRARKKHTIDWPHDFVQVSQHQTSRSWSWPTLLLVFSQ